MDRNLSAVGSGYTQATAYFSSNPTGQMESGGITAPEQKIQKDPDIIIAIPQGSFPSLSGIKDEDASAAKAIHAASKTLDQAESLLARLQDQVAMVKNYPPYPPGNEERVKYIKEIEGLRKQIDALVVPKVAESFPPVFYPREVDFPQLDAEVPSDAAVLAFGEAVQAVQHKVNAGRAELRAQAEQLSGRVGLDLPLAQVQTISIAVAGKLGATTQPLAGNTGALVQLGG